MKFHKKSAKIMVHFKVKSDFRKKKLVSEKMEVSKPEFSKIGSLEGHFESF